MWTPIPHGPRTTFRSSPTGRRPAARPMCAKFPLGARNSRPLVVLWRGERCHWWRGMRGSMWIVCAAAATRPPHVFARRSFVSPLSLSLSYFLCVIYTSCAPYVCDQWSAVRCPDYILFQVCVRIVVVCVRVHVCLSSRMCVYKQLLRRSETRERRVESSNRRCNN